MWGNIYNVLLYNGKSTLNIYNLFEIKHDGSKVRGRNVRFCCEEIASTC